MSTLDYYTHCFVISLKPSLFYYLSRFIVSFKRFFFCELRETEISIKYCNFGKKLHSSTMPTLILTLDCR